MVELRCAQVSAASTPTSAVALSPIARAAKMEADDASHDFTGAGDLGYSQASQPFAFESQDDGPSQQVRHPRVLSTHSTGLPAHSPVCCAGRWSVC